jgi:hypothetical protein
MLDNPGDVPCGCVIVFKAIGTVTNPEIMNVDTGEVMRLLTTMTADEEISVYTHFAGKRIVLTRGGFCQNAFEYMDTASTFIQLTPGINTLRYDAADNLDLLEVTVFYKPQMLGA